MMNTLSTVQGTKSLSVLNMNNKYAEKVETLPFPIDIHKYIGKDLFNNL